MTKSKLSKVSTNEGQRLDPTTNLEPPLSDSADVIVPEIEVYQDRALSKHSSKTLCSTCSDPIGVEIEVCQRGKL